MANVKSKNDIIFPSFCYYESEVDYVNIIITVYAATHMDDGNQLRPFEKDVLNYYVRFGYDTATKKRAQKELGKSYATITQATFFLAKKGYLINSRHNLSKKKLNKDLEKLREGFLNGDKKVWALGFRRK